MADSNPPDEVDDGKAPADWDGIAPDAMPSALGSRCIESSWSHEAMPKPGTIRSRRGGEHDGADFSVTVPRCSRLDHRSLLRVARYFVCSSIVSVKLLALVASSASGVR